LQFVRIVSAAPGRGEQTVAWGLAAVEGATTGEVFEAYSELILGPALRPGEVVMDNLSSHKGGRVRELIEG
jgi:hypothetical protein